MQTYYCLRVHRITQNKSIAFTAWVLALARWVFRAAEAGTIVRSGKWDVVMDRNLKWELTASSVVGTASDVAIAAAICIGLLRHRSGFSATDKLVDKLVAYTVGMSARGADVRNVTRVTCRFWASHERCRTRRTHYGAPSSRVAWHELTIIPVPDHVQLCVATADTPAAHLTA